MAPQGQSLFAFPSDIHIHSSKVMVYPWKIIRGEPTSYTYPNFWLSPKCKIDIEPKSIFNLPYSDLCFHERMSHGTRFIEVAGDWE